MNQFACVELSRLYVFHALVEPPDPLQKTDTVAHTIRLPPELNHRVMERAKGHPNLNAYVLWVLTKDVVMPDVPDCSRCGYRAMGEYITEMLRGETLFGKGQ